MITYILAIIGAIIFAAFISSPAWFPDLKDFLIHRRHFNLTISELKDKDKIIYYVLNSIKADQYTYCQQLINASRRMGKNYPEFKIIEKSLKSNKKFSITQ